MSKVLIVGSSGNCQYAEMFRSRGWTVVVDPREIFDVDLIQFTGGEDVTPEIYGEENTDSYNNFARDLREAGFFAIGQRLGKPMAGICRGGQFLNVMCGGKMIQDIPGHAIGGTHKVYDHATDRNRDVTSTHHQGILPAVGLDGEIEGEVAVAPDGITEVVSYYYDKVLCFQPHPEFYQNDCQDYYFELLNDYLGVY